MVGNKIAIVTGANTGIGYEIALDLVERNYEVILACRNLEKASVAKKSILDKFPTGKIGIIKIDLSEFSSVIKFVKKFKEKYSHINLLVNNAGIFDDTGKKNSENNNLVMYTNYFGHFLLTQLLLDFFIDEESSRIVSVSSVMHKVAKIFFDDINCQKKFHKKKAYGQSKLACLMFADELDRQLKKDNKKILSVAAHPGGCKTNIFDGMIPENGKIPLKYKLLKYVDKFMANSNKEAAESILYVATSNNIKGGEYIGPKGFLELKGKIGKAKRNKFSKNRENLIKLWEYSLKVIKI